MVNVGMCEKYKVYVGGRHGKLAIFINIRALLHAAVNQKLFAAGFKQGAGARNLVCRTEKCQFHKILRSCFSIIGLSAAYNRSVPQSYDKQINGSGSRCHTNNSRYRKNNPFPFLHAFAPPL